MNSRAAILIVLIGFQLRSIILAVPPVLPDVRHDLHLSFSSTGALTAIPVLGLGAAAVPGALLVNRFGARTVVSIAVFGLGVTAIIRIGPPLPYSLFLATAVLAVFIAIAQPAITVLIRSWWPDRVQQISTLYALSLVFGGLVGSTLTVYLLTLTGWRGTFVLWGLLAIVASIVWFRFAPGRLSTHVPEPTGLRRLASQRQVWHVAGLFGGQSLVFYGGVAWIPFLLHTANQTYLALVLLLLQIVSLPLAGIVSMTRLRWATSRWWYMAGGLFMMIGSGALGLGITDLAWVWAPIMGLGNSMVFMGANALPPILAERRSDVAAYTALVLTVGYALAFMGPILGGVVLDHTGAINSPFWVLLFSGIATVVLGATFSSGEKSAARSSATVEPESLADDE